jgi:uncharacterized membrane protein
MLAAVTGLTQRLMSVVAILAVCGIVVSSVSLQHHFATSKSAYCDIGEMFNCDIVNRSVYSSVFGIPVALIGMLGYATGLAFALYLTYIEARVLGVWCILCLSSLALIATTTILAAVIWWKRDMRE